MQFTALQSQWPTSSISRPLLCTATTSSFRVDSATLLVVTCNSTNHVHSSGLHSLVSPSQGANKSLWLMNIACTWYTVTHQIQNTAKCKGACKIHSFMCTAVTGSFHIEIAWTTTQHVHSTLLLNLVSQHQGANKQVTYNDAKSPAWAATRKLYNTATVVSTESRICTIYSIAKSVANIIDITSTLCTATTSSFHVDSETLL